MNAFVRATIPYMNAFVRACDCAIRSAGRIDSDAGRSPFFLPIDNKEGTPRKQSFPILGDKTTVSRFESWSNSTLIYAFEFAVRPRFLARGATMTQWNRRLKTTANTRVQETPRARNSGWVPEGA